jgi:hypothetical protein
MYDYLAARDLDGKLASDNGWYPVSAKDSQDGVLRMVIPASNRNVFAYWQARRLDEGILNKYLSPHVPREDSVVIVCPGLKVGVERPGVAVVVEGPLDALAAAGAGTGRVGVGMMGATPPLEAYAFIARLFRTLLVVPDNDETGEETTGRWITHLAARGAAAWLRRVPAEYKDLAECPPAVRRRVTGEL